MMKFDVVVVGAGIVGLAHAWEARRRGLSVAVVERGTRCTGASIRNFGFITVSGQGAGDTWRRAYASAHAWRRIAPQAGIRIEHEGSWIVCQRPEASLVANEFMQTEMAEICSFYQPDQFAQLKGPDGIALTQTLQLQHASGILHSSLDLRVESREAIGQLARWLEDSQGVKFYFNETVIGVDLPTVRTSTMHLKATYLLACPGAEFSGPFKSWMAAHDLSLCTLQMLRVQMPMAGRLPGSVMTDNSLARYRGWAELPAGRALKSRLRQEMPQYLAEGIHLIVVQSADGSLVVGDSHVYGAAEDVFARAAVDELILELLSQTVKGGAPRVIERWTGVYPSGAHDALIQVIDAQTRLVTVTSGTGASTAFGLAMDTFDTLE